MWPIYLVLGLFTVLGLLAVWERFELPGSIMWRAQRTSRRHIERLSRMPAAELVAEARTAIQAAHWEKFGPARALLEKDDWTDEGLLRMLDELYAALSEVDGAKGRAGPGSEVFEFYDGGLASIYEAIQKRRPPPGGTPA